jgi:hypothetical protein
MTSITPFMTPPEEWTDQLGALAAEIKALEGKAMRLKDKLKLHMTEKELTTVTGGKFEYRRQTGERTDFSEDAITETFGPDAVTKLPKKKTESFRIVERKVEADPKVKEIVDHFSKDPSAAVTPEPAGVETKVRRAFPE